MPSSAISAPITIVRVALAAGVTGATLVWPLVEVLRHRLSRPGRAMGPYPPPRAGTVKPVRTLRPPMYVSRAVETIRDDPVPDASVSLVVETQDDVGPDGVAAALESAGATLERRLQFDDLLVTVAQDDVDAVCAVDGIAGIQTADAIGVHPDEAEDSAARSAADRSNGPAVGPRNDFDPEE